ncbi:hypothetical protein NSQ62_07655 [Solibacillus sp. FSL H8-0523]|uniref:hypothetical protein n=1 Tax=Solibacillus sp. FSL H8-0523 TaxID=2954511 RepID=UPI003100AAAA
MNQIFIWSITEIPGWHYAEKWMYYQKTNGRVVCYISQRLFDGYILQLYKRGEMFICDIEYRSHDLHELLTLADEWLETYKDGNLEAIHSHYYSPHNPQGYWEIEYKK